MQDCIHAMKTVELAKEGESVVMHQCQTGTRNAVYAASPSDTRVGRNRAAVCLETGDQLDLTLSPALQKKFGLNQTTVRCTVQAHLTTRDQDFITINGLPNGKNIIEIIGVVCHAFPRGTKAVSTILPAGIPLGECVLDEAPVVAPAKKKLQTVITPLVNADARQPAFAANLANLEGIPSSLPGQPPRTLRRVGGVLVGILAVLFLSQ